MMPNNKIQGSPTQNAQYNPPNGPLMARDNKMQVNTPAVSKIPQQAPQPTTSKLPKP